MKTRILLTLFICVLGSMANATINPSASFNITPASHPNACVAIQLDDPGTWYFSPAAVDAATGNPVTSLNVTAPNTPIVYWTTAQDVEICLDDQTNNCQVFHVCDCNPMPADYIEDAPMVCSFQSTYCGTTSGTYTADANLLDAGDFSGSIENNSWLTFVADSNIIEFNINALGGCSIQFAVYEYNPTGPDYLVLYTPVSWTSGSGFTGNQTISATGLTPGNTYYIMVDGVSGAVCDYEINFTSGIQTLALQASDTTICPGDIITLDVLPGDTSATYLWSDDNGGGPYPDSPSITVSPTVPTNYTVEVDGGACYANSILSLYIQIDQNCNPCTPPNLIVNQPTAICQPGSVDLLTTIDPGSDPGTATFHSSAADASNGVNAISSGVSSSGTYFIRYEDPADTSCASVEAVTVTIDPLDDASFSLTAFCEGDANAASGIATPGGTFAFSPVPSDGATINSSTGEISSGVGGTTYTVEYTTNGTCPNSSTETVTVSVTPTVDAGADQSICDGQQVTLTASNPDGGVLSWDNGVTNNVPFTQPVSTVTYTVNSTLSGCSSSDQVDVTVMPAVSFTLSSTDPTTCGGTDGTITISGLAASSSFDVTYSSGSGVNGPTTMNSNASGDIIITGLGAGSYFGFNVDDGSCPGINNGPINLTEPGSPTVDAGTPQTVCDGDLVTLTAINPDGATLSWSNSVTDGVAFTPSVGTVTYTVTATLAGCVSSDQVNVTVNAIDDASFTFNNFCLNSANGPSNIVTSGGSFSFNPAPGDGATINPTTGEISNETDGATYTVEYTTNGACPSSATVTVSVSGLQLNATVTNETCSQDNGSIDLGVTGGTGNYSYSWTPGGQTTQDLTGLNQGSYTVVVTDNTTGCTENDSYIVSDAGTPPAPGVVHSHEICFGDCAGTITVTLALPDSVVYTINNGSQLFSNYTGLFTDLCPGSYQVTVDGLGCDYPTSIVNINQAPRIGWNALQTYSVNTDCQLLGGNGVVSASAYGGWNNQFTYYWTNLQDTSLHTTNPTWGNRPEGSYHVTATESGTGCTQDTVLDVGVDGPIALFDVDTNWAFSPHLFTVTNLSSGASSYNLVITNSYGDTVQYAISNSTWNADTLIPRSDTMEICLYAYNNFGCVDVYCETVIAVPPPSLVAPNVFTPNASNQNDWFYVPHDGMMEYEVVIFNRWGRKIKELTLDSPRWDGNLENGKPASEGVYFYNYRLVGYDGEVFTGQAELHLIRH